MKTERDHKKQELLQSILKGKLAQVQSHGEEPLIHMHCKSAPLSYAQQRMWFLHQFNTENDSYNMHIVLNMCGELNQDALFYSMLKIVERHDVLRTKFCMDETGEPIQVVRDDLSNSIELVDMRGQDQGRIHAYISQEISKPFDLEHDLPIRAMLLRTEEKRYYLVVIMHHIVADGWSFGVLGKELMRYYRCYLDNDRHVEPLEYQYIDYAYWQKKYLESGRMEKQCKYWKKKLTPLPDKLELKVKGRPELSHRAQKYYFHMDAQRLEGLKQISRETGTTLFMVLLSAYAILINRYSDQNDLVIGTPVANRRRKELEDLIGFFVNTLPIRVQVDDKETFEQMLQGVKRETVGAVSNQDIPFEYIVKEVMGDRYGDQTPIIQTMFVLQNTQNLNVTLPNVEVQTELYENVMAKFDLMLTGIETTRGLQLAFEYKESLFHAQLIESIADKFQRIVDEILENRNQPVGQLACTETAIWNNDPRFAQVKEFSQKTIVDRFCHMAAQYRDKIAVSCNGEEITYGELERRSNQVSRYIRGLMKEEVGFVGICMERSVAMIVSILAVLKCNCAYVPLDPGAPRDRMEFIVKDAQLKLLLVCENSLDGIPIPQEIPVVDLHQKWDEIMNQSEEAPDCARQAMSTAYMIYTSGSTGLPKGVMVGDYHVLRLLSNTEDLYQFNSNDVWTMFHSVAFDFSVWEIWGALLYGGELVIVSYLTSRTPEAFLQLLMEREVTVLNQTPSAFRQLLQCDGIYDAQTVYKLKLRYIIFGGEALDFAMLERWLEVYGDQRTKIVNMYGITETTVHVTYEVLDREMVKNQNGSLIGLPIKDLSIYVLDTHMRMVPDGVVGEMYVGGAGVTKGYWNRPELTAERFIQNPFVQGQEILYKTGDMACRHTNGDLEYIGRNDEQVKVKGFRIELNEIQEKTNEHDMVKDSLVLLDRLEDDARIISYFTLTPQARKAIMQELLEKDDYEEETQELFAYHYGQGGDVTDETFNIAGWNDSYDNQQMTEYEMREWLDSVAQKLKRLPMSSVLELGMGTGMILYQILDRVQRYVGLDICKEAIEYNNRVLAKKDLGDREIQLIHAPAEKVGEKVTGCFDTVILNSVAQYFPDVSYFESTLLAALEHMEDHGHIVVGDVRSYDRLDMYYLSVELAHMDHGQSLLELRRNLDTRRENEKELIFSQSYFRQLQQRIPQISCVEVTPKTGGVNNELSKYRYDVILTIGRDHSVAGQVLNPRRLTWPQGKEGLQQLDGQMIHFANVPDERVEYEARFLKKLDVADEKMTIAQYEKLIKAQAGTGLSKRDEEELEAWAKDHGYHLYMGMDYVPGCLEVVLYPAEVDRQAVIQYLNHTFACDGDSAAVTEPLKYKVQYRAMERITRFLQDKLPYYMIPNEFVLIDKIPLTINGKVDYKALPRPNSSSRVIRNQDDWCEEYIVQEVARVWRNLLHVEEVSLEDNFFQLGGHSLLATNLIFALNDIFHVRIPLKELFENPTILGNSRYIQSRLEQPAPEEKKRLELKKDVQLPALQLGTAADGRQEKILVTGATGFFGAFLVQRLLADTTATVCCLVRAKDPAGARVRLMDTLRQYKLYREEYEPRIVVIQGDLELPNLGIAPQEYDTYAREIDTIIHNGAKVNFFEPYANLKRANVDGTVEIIRFAAMYRVKPVHFISTLYVYEPSEDAKEQKLIQEEQPLSEGGDGLRMGYTQSKWVAENILNLARAQGLPVNIYRLGRISGHSVTGACQQKDFMWSLVKGCVELGVCPNQNLEFEITPVDYLTDGVVQVMKCGEWNTNYHLFNKRKTSLQNIVQAMSDYYKVKAVDRDEWVKRISSADSSARHLAQLLSDGTFDGGYMNFKNDHVAKHVPYFGAGIQVSDSMLKALRDYFVEVGYFPAKQ